MPLVEFELTISAGERPQTYALDRAATGKMAMLHSKISVPLHMLKFLRYVPLINCECFR